MARSHADGQGGVVYSAYGEGEKPRICLSPENGAGGDKWTLLEGTDDIWVYEKELKDCGNIVFNDGENCGKRPCPFMTEPDLFSSLTTRRTMMSGRN